MLRGWSTSRQRAGAGQAGTEKAPGSPCSGFSVLELIEKLESNGQIAIGHEGVV